MGADQDAVQRTVVLAVTVISALLNGAFDALVGLVVHNGLLLFMDSKLVCPLFKKEQQEKISNSCIYAARML